MSRRLIPAFVGAAAVYPLSATASAYHVDGYHHHWGDGAMGMGGGWFGFVMMLLWTLLLVAVVVAFLYWAFGKGGSSETESDAMEILRERYARGEIEDEEFRERKRSLTEG